MRNINWFRMCAWGTCSLAILGADAVGTRWSASAVEPPLEQYITLDDGLYALQADGTYSKVEGNRPQSLMQTHTGNHVHDNSTLVRPNGGGPQQNGKYLRLDDGLYVLQSDGTYMLAQNVPGPVWPGNRPNSNNQQVWQDDGRRPQQQWQDDGWDDDGNGWNQPQWQGNDYRPQPQWINNLPVRPNRPSTDQDVSGLSYEGPSYKNGRWPQPQWIDNRPVRPNRPSNDQDVSGLMQQGNAEHADDGRSDLEKLGEFLDAIIQ